jgi:hypothetical protein
MGEKLAYEYMMIQMPPTIAIKAAQYRGNEAAAYLQELVNQQAAAGWEFYRVDTVGVVVQPGCLASLLFGRRADHVEYYVVTFRRPR